MESVPLTMILLLSVPSRRLLFTLKMVNKFAILASVKSNEPFKASVSVLNVSCA